VRRRSGLLALLMLFSLAAAATEAPPDESGQGRAQSAGQSIVGLPGPALSIRTIDGQTIDLAKRYGHKPVYLKFWATWCVPCRQQMPGFEQDYEKLGKRIDFVAVNVGFNDTEAAVRDYRSELGLHMPIVVDDGRLAAALNLRVTPQHVVIGRDGRVLYVGHLANDRLQAAFQEALKEGGAAAGGRQWVAERRYNVGDSPSDLAVETSTAGTVPLVPAKGDLRPRALVFFSPWCESYLAKSRPGASQACRRVREEVDALAPGGDVQWVGIASGLWASANDLTDYQKTTGTAVPLTLDTSGQLFRAFGVREVPTVVLLDTAGHVVRKLGPEDHDLKDAIQSLTPHAAPH
jgi:thiol-disulfide isomerase/thioredoxin